MTLLTFNRPEHKVVNDGRSNEYKDFMNSFVRASQRYAHDCSKVPSVNIFEEPAQFVLEVAAPGYSKSDFNVNIEKDILTISAEVSEKKDDTKFLSCEFSKGSFSRQFTLGKSVDASKVDAAYSNGILTVKLKKREEAIEKPARKINVD